MVFWDNRIIGLLRQAAIDQAKPKIRVVDTESFIQAAKAVWGDKYDYSQTNYRSSSMPIKIICRKCGPFTLSSAYAHIRSYKGKYRSCGCRHCETLVAIRKKGKETKCILCGDWAKYASIAAHPMCESCKSNEQVQEAWNMACLGLKQLRKKARHNRRSDMQDPWAIRCRTALVALRSRASRQKQKALVPPTSKPDLTKPPEKKVGLYYRMRTYTRNGRTYQYRATIKPVEHKPKSQPFRYSNDWSGTVSREKHKLGRKGKTKWQRKIATARQTLRARVCRPTKS